MNIQHLAERLASHPEAVTAACDLAMLLPAVHCWRCGELCRDATPEPGYAGGELAGPQWHAEWIGGDYRPLCGRPECEVA